MIEQLSSFCPLIVWITGHPLLLCQDGTYNCYYHLPCWLTTPCWLVTSIYPLHATPTSKSLCYVNSAMLTQTFSATLTWTSSATSTHFFYHIDSPSQPCQHNQLGTPPHCWSPLAVQSFAGFWFIKTSLSLTPSPSRAKDWTGLDL